MRLATFIEQAEADIVAEAVAFARTLSVLGQGDEALLRNHIPEMLHTISADLRTAQSAIASIAKSRGEAAAAHVVTEADGHGKQRALAGLSIDQLVAEYRAMRASILRLWAKSGPPGADAVADITRFNEAVDQAIAESIRAYVKETESRRQFFLAALGHDLRGPLNAIALTAAALNLDRANDPPQMAVHTRTLTRSAARMKQLLESLLDYNLIGLGRAMVLDLAPADLFHECEEEMSILRAAFPNARIELAAAGDCRGMFDASRIREALGNLVSNAAHHGELTEPVRVSVAGDSPDTVEISVTNAIREPISAAELVQLFDPMRRSSAKPASGQRTNLGLGLFIAQEIAKALGGAVNAVCQAKVICFTVSLPKRLAPGHPIELKSKPAGG